MASSNNTNSRRQKQNPALTNLPLSKAQQNAIAAKLVVGYDGLRKLGIPHHRTRIWALIQEGEFPAPLPYGRGGLHGRKAWRIRDIRNWLESQPLIQLAKKVG